VVNGEEEAVNIEHPTLNIEVKRQKWLIHWWFQMRAV
jgi:hypothetical protein